MTAAPSTPVRAVQVRPSVEVAIFAEPETLLAMTNMPAPKVTHRQVDVDGNDDRLVQVMPSGDVE
jgi:hypothetical protein